MTIDCLFSKEEKTQFLQKLDYKITNIEVDYWDQWGNHDSQGSWASRPITCAIKNNETPSELNKLDDIFKEEINKKLKKLLIEF